MCKTSLLISGVILRRFLLVMHFCVGLFSDVFLFEELPAKDQRTDQIYLKEVEKCDIYLGIFGYEYGYENRVGYISN